VAACVVFALTIMILNDEAHEQRKQPRGERYVQFRVAPARRLSYFSVLRPAGLFEDNGRAVGEFVFRRLVHTGLGIGRAAAPICNETMTPPPPPRNMTQQRFAASDVHQGNLKRLATAGPSLSHVRRWRRRFLYVGRRAT